MSNNKENLCGNRLKTGGGICNKAIRGDTHGIKQRKHCEINQAKQGGGEVAMISKKTIRARVRQRMAAHPNSYAHEHIAPVSQATGQSEEVAKICLLEGVVMTAYALHRQPLSTCVLSDAVQMTKEDEKFIATQAKVRCHRRACQNGR